MSSFSHLLVSCVCFRGDYEVDFYCKVLEDRTDQLKRSQVAKNRRLAYMAR